MKSYACMRSLHRQGIRTVVASKLDRVPHFASRYCAERVQLAAGPDDVRAYRDALLDLARRPDIETVVPVREVDAYVLAKYRRQFRDHVSLATPDLETLRDAHDRLRLARAAAEAGVPHADTRQLSSMEDWTDEVVVKSRYNLLTGDYVDAYPGDDVDEPKGVWFVSGGERPDEGALREAFGHDPIVQEFVPRGRKHLYCALYDHGEPVATYQHEEVRGDSWVGGGGVYRESVTCQPVEEVAYDLLNHLEWHGLACIEYVKDAETGEWKFLELNPRAWKSLPAAVRAGAEFPYYYWLQARDEPDRVDDDYQVGVGCHLLYGELAHLLSIVRDDCSLAERPSLARTTWEVLTTCLTSPRFDYLRADDPRFFLSALRSALAADDSDGREFNDGITRDSDGQRVDDGATG
jgi:predicted ATP-grasp superfamily ATP-dependent carboligase